MFNRARSSEKLSQNSQDSEGKQSKKDTGAQSQKDNGLSPLFSPNVMTEGRDSRRGSISDVIAYVTGAVASSSNIPNSPGNNSSRSDKLNVGGGIRSSVLRARSYITGNANESGRDSPTDSPTRHTTSNVLKSVASLLFLKGSGPSNLLRRDSSVSMGDNVSGKSKSPILSRRGSQDEQAVYHRRLARFSPTELALHAVITNPIGIGYFLGFCASEHHLEYINFFLQVEEYKALSGIKSLFVCDSLPAVVEGDEEVDIPLSWMAIDEKIFKTTSDDLSIASRLLVDARSVSKSAYRRMSLQGEDGEQPMDDMHPLAVKICHIYLHEQTFAARAAVPAPLGEGEEGRPKPKKRVSVPLFQLASLSSKTSTKSLPPLRNKFAKNNASGGAIDSMASLLSPRKTPRSYLMSPRIELTTVENDITPSPEHSTFGLDERTPICLSKRVASNTKLRLDFMNYYGAEAFSEAALEVFRFLAQDIYPRFLRSSWHDRMKKHGKLVIGVDRGDFAHLLPRANTLRLRPPESKILESLSAGGGPSSMDQALSQATAAVAAAGGGAASHRRSLTQSRGRSASSSQGSTSQPKLFNVDDIVSDGILYNEFLQRLKQTSNTEYLLCLRAINVFKDIINPPPPKPKINRRSMTQRRSIIAVASKRERERDEAYPKGNSSSSRASISEGPDERRSLRSSLGSLENPDSGYLDEQRQTQQKAQKLEDQAWQIYLFFVAKGASLEITLVQKHREDIMRQLATPTISMFDNLEAAAKTELEYIFANYKRGNQESYLTWESRATIIAQNIYNIETGTKNSRWKKQFSKKLALVRRIFKRKLKKIFIS